MESRLIRIEAILPTLARKENLAVLEKKFTGQISHLERNLNALEVNLTTLVHKESAVLTRRMLYWSVVVVLTSWGNAFIISSVMN